MASKPSTTIHTRIGHERALCGANPMRQIVSVVSNAEFMATPAESRCRRCAKLYRARGYDIAIPDKTKKKSKQKAPTRRATAAYYRQQPDQ
jgi:hypothetical protein